MSPESYRYKPFVISMIRSPSARPRLVLQMLFPRTAVMVRLWKEEEGQDLTEYALLCSFCFSLAAIATLGTLASAINSVFNRAASNLTAT